MRPLRIALAVALAVRAVLHRDETELDQAAVDRLDLGRRETERLLLHPGRGPYDRPAPLLPVLRLGEAEQPVDRMHQARRNAEPRRGRLEGGKQLPRRRHALWQAGKAFGRAVGLQQPRRQPPEAGRRVGTPPLWRPLGAIVLCHRDPPFWLDRDGQAFPVDGNGNFR